MQKIIIGLGNPGIEYAGTRHNAGLMLVDKLASLVLSDYGWRREKEAIVFRSEELTLVKPANVFMNESGRLVAQYKDREVWIAHDDLDIKLGEYKVQRGIGPKVHNGVISVEHAMGTKEFWRIRIGVENRQAPISGETYVLQRFSPEEKVILEEVLDAICNSLLHLPLKSKSGDFALRVRGRT